MKQLLRWIMLTILFAYALQAETRLELSLSNPSPYVGEPILAIYTLHSDHPIGGRDPYDPKFPGWWSVPMEEANVSDAGHTIRWVYRLSAQHSGTIALPPQSVATTHMDPKTYAIARTRYDVSAQPIHVRPLPSGISIVGAFDFQETFEHNTTHPNTPATLTVMIEGKGNIDDIPPFDLNLTGALVLASRPVRHYHVDKGTLRARFTQRFTLVADHTLTIAPLSLTVFNPRTRLVEILQSAPHTLTIHGRIKNSHQRWLPYLFVGVGFLLGLLAAFLWRRRPRKLRGSVSLENVLRHARNDRQRYAALLPHADCIEIQPLLRQLEVNLFRGGNKKIDYRRMKRAARSCVETA